MNILLFNTHQDAKANIFQFTRDWKMYKANHVGVGRRLKPLLSVLSIKAVQPIRAAEPRIFIHGIAE